MKSSRCTGALAHPHCTSVRTCVLHCTCTLHQSVHIIHTQCVGVVCYEPHFHSGCAEFAAGTCGSRVRCTARATRAPEIHCRAKKIPEYFEIWQFLCTSGAIMESCCAKKLGIAAILAHSNVPLPPMTTRVAKHAGTDGYRGGCLSV